MPSQQPPASAASAAAAAIAALPPLPPLPPLQATLLALLLPLLAYIAHTLHALLATHRAAAAAQTASTDAFLRELRSVSAAAAEAAAERATKDNNASGGSVNVEKDLIARATRAVERVVGAAEAWEKRWGQQEQQQQQQQHHQVGGGHNNNTNNNGQQQHNSNGNSNGVGVNGSHVRRGSAASTGRGSMTYSNWYNSDDDTDLYRRKVEAMEGLRRLMEAQRPAPAAVEDADLYRRRVEALEGLRRVLEMQPGVGFGAGVQGYGGSTVAAGRKKGVGRGGGGGGAVAGLGGMNFGAALSVKSEGRALKKEKSAETLGESLLDL
ncbi:uncharacterized protein BKCO1_7000162 [Diplodia corticola]|uniref:Uncharacterized protein n=1 Tax=Diplodia corticola TaxID=236234 RepID=A0A1J9RXQ6_9PEZI|nr:uncharacterized protein BKCO1_7000162 [Diplodia corticola]OJD37427.1 hypothetical protein BKCO1_7000162 [Diplodia corticola]